MEREIWACIDLTRQLHPVTQATTGIRGGFSMNTIIISCCTAVRSTKMTSHAIALVSSRGVGEGSRIPKGTVKDDLPVGWWYDKRSKKYSVWYDDKGRRYKSSTEVQAELRKQGLLLESETDIAEESLSESTSLDWSSSRAHVQCKKMIVRHGKPTMNK